jgi:hypothetical protein
LRNFARERDGRRLGITGEFETMYCSNKMKEKSHMNTAEICWLVLLGGIVIVAVVSFLSSIPELRRYLRLRDM